MEEYLLRRGDTRTNFDYNFDDVLPSDGGTIQGQQVKEVIHNFTEDKHDRTLEDGDGEIFIDINREHNGEPHESLPEKPHADVTEENEAQPKEPEQILDDIEPNILSIRKEFDRSEFQAHDSPELLTHDSFDVQAYGLDLNHKSEIQTHDKHKLSIHDILEKQALNIPELGIYETPVPKAIFKPINKKYLKKSKHHNDLNKKQTLKQGIKGISIKTNPKAIIKDTEHEAYGEVHNDARVTTKKSHYIPKPSTQLQNLADTFQKTFLNDLKNYVEDKITNKPYERPQKNKTAIKLKSYSEDETQLINFKDIYASSDNDKDSMLKNTLGEPKTPLEDKSISEENVIARFKNIYQTDNEKKVTSRVQDLTLTSKAENVTNDELELTEYDEEDDKLKNYYNRGKLITGQTVKDIIDGKNIFLTYTNEYPFGGRRNLDESVPESIEPNTGELVNSDTNIANYDPEDGTIDGLGAVKINKNITNNGTQAKKHHHRHHRRHHKNKTHLVPVGFPGKLPDLLFLDISLNENLIPD